MATMQTVMTQVMNNPTVFIAGLAIGYIGAKLQRKLGRNSGGFGGGGF
ncbi:hypothetical protein ACK3SF_00480 [Candidatus Nanosalina sp. VS9-1]